MAKSKNHTAHNQNKKDHRNGIKKVKTARHTSLKGIHQKYVLNLHYARKHTPHPNNQVAASK